MKTEIETYQQLFENIDRLSQTSVNILEISEGEDRLFLSACTERLLTLKKLCLMGKLFVEMMVTSRPLNDASPNIQNLEYIYDCQTAHCGRYIPHFDFGAKPSPIVPYRHLPQSLSGMTADCRSLV